MTSSRKYRSRNPPSVHVSIERPQPCSIAGFDGIDPARCIEEEELPGYRADRFYPVRLGEILQGRYHILTKLGFGSSSTTWLARDLVARGYVALKIYVHTSLVHRELPAYDRIAHRVADSSHRGRGNIRSLLDSFETAQMRLRDMKVVFRPNAFDEEFVRGAIIELLEALDLLHTQAEIVHTDVHTGNMLLGAYDNEIFKTMEEYELTFPVPRKQISDTRTIYHSRAMRPNGGPMLLSDFGEARIGPGPHGGDIMPLEYRAPETLLYVAWSYPVDIWSVGLTDWDLLEPKRLFTVRDNAAHFAQLIAALERRADFWDDQGKWLGLAPIPKDRMMESLGTQLKDKTGFLRFIRRTLTWLPEKRPTAKELLKDPWLVEKTS
ncbi:kinase-like protein [Aspergillus heterothallicus]